jgi:hypothetical protein
MSGGWMALGAMRCPTGFLVGMLGVGCGGNTAIKSSELPEVSGVKLAGNDLICAKEGFLCDPKGLAFAQFAFGVSDACGGLIGDCPNPPPRSTTATLSQAGQGKLCMAGRVKAGGGAQVIIAYTAYNYDATKVLQKFDANARGIKQAAFTLDTPPSGGVSVNAAVVTKQECGTEPEDFCLEHISFGVEAGPYDFCIHDLKFLDAAGNEVNP